MKAGKRWAKGLVVDVAPGLQKQSFYESAAMSEIN